MIKLIFSKFEDINKAATFLEKKFIIVIDLGICCYLSIVRTFRKLGNFWKQTSRFNCIENFGGKNSGEIYFITEKRVIFARGKFKFKSFLNGLWYEPET